MKEAQYRKKKYGILDFIMGYMERFLMNKAGVFNFIVSKYDVFDFHCFLNNFMYFCESVVKDGF